MSTAVKAGPKTSGVPFKPEMVRALRAGRKTMTRRLVKPQPTWEPVGYDHGHWACEDGEWSYLGRFRDGGHRPVCGPFRPPFGNVGDRIYVKEATYRDADGMARYVADDAAVMCELGPAPWTWKPSTLASMYMPRWAARDYRDVVGLRVERLNDISEADAVAEGVEADQGHGLTAFGKFSLLWDSINGSGSWYRNELVWVYSLSGMED